MLEFKPCHLEDQFNCSVLSFSGYVDCIGKKLRHLKGSEDDNPFMDYFDRGDMDSVAKPVTRQR